MYIKIFCEHKLRIQKKKIKNSYYSHLHHEYFLASHDGTISVKFIKDV